MYDIGTWLAQHGLGRYTDAFAANDIGLDVLSDLDRDDLKDLGVSFGDSKRLLRAIETLESDPAPDASLSISSPVQARIVETKAHFLSKARYWMLGRQGVEGDASAPAGRSANSPW